VTQEKCLVPPITAIVFLWNNLETNGWNGKTKLSKMISLCVAWHNFQYFNSLYTFFPLFRCLLPHDESILLLIRMK
jgi:hypothetical protein